MGIMKCLGYFKACDVTDKATSFFSFFFFLWDNYEYASSLFLVL